MRCRPSHAAPHVLFAVLVVFAARALVPPGYMPSHERPWSFEICPEGWPATLVHPGTHAHSGAHASGTSHPGPHARGEHCVFGTLCAWGPASAPIGATVLLIQPLSAAATVPEAPAAMPRVCLPEPRGPPSAA